MKKIITMNLIPMSELIEKSSVGTIGFIGSVGLADVNGVLSALVAILTIVYLGVSIHKKIKEK